MLNKTIKFLLENKLVTILLLVIFVFWGIISAPFDWDIDWLPRNPVAVDAIPDIGENQQIVFTKWDGQSPQDIEDQITYPLMISLLGIPGVKTIRSSSMFGFSTIFVIFDEKIDFYWSRSRILEKLNSLPANLLPIGVKPSLGPDATGLGQIFWYTLEGRDTSGNVTGGWDLQELRSIQDYYVKYGLASAKGVSEVASIGGFVKEYQVDVDPAKLQQYDISLKEVVNAVRNSNKDIGAKTLEINNAEYLIRGLGYVKKIEDLENSVVKSVNNTPVLVKDLAHISLGPQERRGILDKNGAEVVGGVVVARYGANPMEVIKNVKSKMRELSTGLPSKTLKDGRESQLTIVPFYDRTKLIEETLFTLNDALALEILVTILVIMLMLFNLRSSMLISGLLPLAVLMVFIAMKMFNVDANIVALSGIAIAIGTMVDIGIILIENVIKKLKELKGHPVNQIVYKATSEVSGAILTAVMTTIVSFLPVFTMQAAEGKLFRPLAFTKTFALIAALFVGLFIIPTFASLIFKERKKLSNTLRLLINIFWIILGVFVVYEGIVLGILISLFGIINILSQKYDWVNLKEDFIKNLLGGLAILWLLTEYWRPLDFDRSLSSNFVFVAASTLSLLIIFYVFQIYYVRLLRFALKYKVLFLILPVLILVGGYNSFKSMGKEFMPSLDEGAFLLMPTTMPHAGVQENKKTLKLLDIAVANIPEVDVVVGKAGRVQSALDPAPLSMFENIIQYLPEYIENKDRDKLRFKVDETGKFYTKDSDERIEDMQKVDVAKLIPDDEGKFFRQWRKEIKSPDDIWNKIVEATKLPGVTSAPKLQPIETRLVMLQTGMRSPMGIKIKGLNLKDIEKLGMEFEKALKEVPGVKSEAVFADRIIGKPYLLLDIDRQKAALYGLKVNDIQETIMVALGGKKVSTTVEGRERYSIRVRYPRELRTSPDDLRKVIIKTPAGEQILLGDLVDVKYERGPQVIKGEDTFLIGYVLFDKEKDEAEVNIVEKAQSYLAGKIEKGEIVVPQGVSYQFTGTYENQIRSEKRLMIVLPLSLMIIFLILYFQFRAVSTTLMVFTGIFVAFSGGFIMLWLYSQGWFLDFDVFGKNMRDIFNIHTVNLSVAIWVGFIALFGIATDDGVVMATYLTQIFEENKPTTKQSIRDAVVEAGRKRIRPCLMTTATTILALLPVLTSKGRGSDIMIPMAIPAFGGMLVALITLFVVPVLYSWVKERRARVR